MTAPVRQCPAGAARAVRSQLDARRPVTVTVDGSRGWWVLDAAGGRVTVYRDGRTQIVEWASVQVDGGPQ